ncbi:MAG: lycopene cyclase domain-containing protein [Candidatus Nanopelagicaceae bacterium]|nr:lycopene cyclase domain-containing protein [Candidatus Nanopelagicaceae bacterium]
MRFELTYTQITVYALIITIFFDMFITRNSLLSTMRFWFSYSIILPFQLLTNWWLTSREIVTYNPDSIMGLRVAGAPFEDLIFGFAMVLAVMSMWEALVGRKNSA